MKFLKFMAWLAQYWANIAHPTDNHTPTVRFNAIVVPTLPCYLGICFLAHLSQRLIGELIGYSWSGIRPSSSVVVRRPSSVVNNFKHLLLQNRLPDQCQILCGASLGRGNESLFAASGSHDQDGRHAHIW